MMTSLAPLTLIVIWSIFMFSDSMITSLVMLLACSLVLPLMFMDFLKLFWPCGLLLILMSTGLIVIFAYIVSLHMEGKAPASSKWLPVSLLIIMMVTLLPSWVVSSVTKTVQLNLKIMVEPLLSLVAIYILLFLVVNFVRLVYSKGGGFRKKF